MRPAVRQDRCESYTGRCRVAGEVGGFRLGLPSLPLCRPGNEALSLFTRILWRHTQKLLNFQVYLRTRAYMLLCTKMWSWVDVWVCVLRCLWLLHVFNKPQCAFECVCSSVYASVYRVVFSVCGSSAVRFPVLPPPPSPPPSSLFPRSDLREEKERDIYFTRESTSSTVLNMGWRLSNKRFVGGTSSRGELMCDKNKITSK